MEQIGNQIQFFFLLMRVSRIRRTSNHFPGVCSFPVLLDSTLLMKSTSSIHVKLGAEKKKKKKSYFLSHFPLCISKTIPCVLCWLQLHYLASLVQPLSKFSLSFSLLNLFLISFVRLLGKQSKISFFFGIYGFFKSESLPKTMGFMGCTGCFDTTRLVSFAWECRFYFLYSLYFSYWNND